MIRTTARATFTGTTFTRTAAFAATFAELFQPRFHLFPQLGPLLGGENLLRRQQLMNTLFGHLQAQLAQLVNDLHDRRFVR